MSHLHLVTDKPAPPRRRGRAAGLSLSSEEAKHLRAAIRGLAKTRYANLVALALALGVTPRMLYRRGRPHPGLAVAVWRLTAIPLDVLLTGKLTIVPATLDAPDPPRIA